MKAFVCVYKHPNPTTREWNATQAAASSQPPLREFLDRYPERDCYYDWGDDPAFYAAGRFLGNACAASWGVCRRDVRMQLNRGDFVVWFCAKSHPKNSSHIFYYFIGCTTVLDTIDRVQLWTSDQYAPYRPFYNTLVRLRDKELQHEETFHEYHDDWRRRLEAPYVLFNGEASVSRVNLSSPLFVAERVPGASLETWRGEHDAAVAMLESVLFRSLGVVRRLRTTNPRVPHRHIALHQFAARRTNSHEFLTDLRAQLIELVGRRQLT